jgi:tetratricopeptide (TPR) repeat protein
MRLTLAVGALALVCAAAPMAAADGGGGGMSSMPSSPSGGGGNGSANDAAAAYRDGIAALQAHNYHEAVRLLRVAQRGARNNGQVNYVLGLASYLDNDKDGARTALERAVHASDAPADARAVLGIVYLQLGDQPHALEQQTALQTALNACDAACGDARHAELQRALDKLTQAITPPTPAATTPAPDSTTPPATNSPSSWTLPNYGDGRAAYAEAVGYINEEHWGDAFVALEHAQAAVGPHPDVLNYMGFVSRKMGHFDDAFAYYGQALAIDPNHLGANEYLGELYVQLGMFDRARAQLARLDRLCTYGCVQREELAHWINASAQQ